MMKALEGVGGFILANPPMRIESLTGSKSKHSTGIHLVDMLELKLKVRLEGSECEGSRFLNFFIFQTIRLLIIKAPKKQYDDLVRRRLCLWY